MAEPNSWIIEPTAATFEQEVIERSRDVPVVVDFWAPWCGPCKQLAPLFEQLVREQQGKFVLAKINVDASPELAGLFGIQSIPLVVAFRDGRPINQFMGLLPEPQLREWLASVLPSQAEELFSRGEALEPADPAAAENCYREALQLEPDNDSLRIHLARVLLAQNRDDDAERMISELEQRGYLEPEAEALKSQLEIRSAAAEAGGVDEARQAAEANPENLALQLKLADALAAARQYQRALDICLTLIERDKAGIGGEAKQTMVRIFDMLGPQSELAAAYRRKLATVLY